MSINKVTLLGHVCADPKVYTFENGEKMCSFNVATTEKGYTTKEGHIVMDSTEFHHIVVKRSALVKIVEEYVKKGKRIYCEGKIKSRNIGVENGEIKTVKDIVVDAIELL